MRRFALALLGIAAFGGISATAPRAAAAPPPAAPKVIDLNRASFDELLAFDGIGRLYAAKIIAARPFTTRSELVARNVLPTSIYLAIKHRLFVTPVAAASEPTTGGTVPAGMLDLNRASVDDLLAVPGIGRAYADRIVSGRPYRSEQEIVGRRIMPEAAYLKIAGKVAVAR